MSALRISPLARRCFSSGVTRTTPVSMGPSPPRLPEKEQKEFEELQRASTGAFSTPRKLEDTSKPGDHNAQATSEQASVSDQLNARINAKGNGEELHPDVRRGAPPEFEGERNPKTGEIGGPKNDPLRWGGEADWSYNGRVTDF